MLTGCFDNSWDYFDDYQTKIANVQDADEIQEDWEFESLPKSENCLLKFLRSLSGLSTVISFDNVDYSIWLQKETPYLEKSPTFRNYDYQVALLEGVGQCLSNNELDQDRITQRNQRAAKTRTIPTAPMESHLCQWSDAVANAAGSQWCVRDIGEQVRRTSDALKHINQVLNIPLSFRGKTTEVQEGLEKSSTLESFVLLTISLPLLSLIPLPNNSRNFWRQHNLWWAARHD